MERSMMKQADLAGLSEEQADRFEVIDRDVAQSREGIAAWHRLLDRRRLDRKLGLHEIPEFKVDGKPAGRDAGTLVRSEVASDAQPQPREPFYVHTEAEARGLLIRSVGYLCNAAGEKLAFDKGYGERDKMAEWIIKEIRDQGGIAYIRKHSPYIFGIEIAAAGA